MSITQEILKVIQDDIESLETTEGDSVECISIENLEAHLKAFFIED